MQVLTDQIITVQNVGVGNLFYLSFECMSSSVEVISLYDKKPYLRKFINASGIV